VRHWLRIEVVYALIAAALAELYGR
jgi:hypothetical protein